MTSVKAVMVQGLALSAVLLIGAAVSSADLCPVASRDGVVGGACKCKQMINPATNNDQYPCPGGLDLCGFYRQCDTDDNETGKVCCVQIKGCRDKPAGCSFHNENNCWKPPCPEQ